METLSPILGLLSMLAMAVFTIGLIKPSWVKASSRGKVLLRIGIAFVVFIIAIAINPNAGKTPTEKPETVAAQEPKAEPATTKVEKQEPAKEETEAAKPEQKPEPEALKEEEKPEPAKEPEKPKEQATEEDTTKDDGKTFDFTLPDFKKRFHAIMAEADVKLKLKDKKTTEGAKGRSLTQIETGVENVAFMVEAKPDGKITSVIMFGSAKEGEPMNGIADVLVAMAGTIGSVDKSLRKEDRGDILMKKLKIGDVKPGEPYNSEYTKNGITYSFSLNQITGMMLTVYPAE